MEKGAVPGSSDAKEVASINIPAGAIPQGTCLVVNLEDLNESLMPILANFLETKATFAGLLNSAISLYLSDPDAAVPKTLAKDIQITVQINTAVVRKQGGEYAKEDKTLDLTIPGYQGVYAFQMMGGLYTWVNQTKLGWDSIGNTANVLNLKASMVGNSGSLYLANIATKPCYTYRATGKAGGNKIVVLGPEDATLIQKETPVQLGGGTLSKMPAVSASTRKALSDENKAQLTKGTLFTALQNSPQPYVPRATWKRLCSDGLKPADTASSDCILAGSTWFSARMAHTTAAISKTRILVYGGIGCQEYDQDGTTCITLTEPLTDLWEIDTLRAANGLDGIKKLGVSPDLKGLAGMTASRIEGADHRILVFGGDYEFYALNTLTGTRSQSSNSNFRVRDVLFRQRKVVPYEVAAVSASSFHSISTNATHTIMFGGYTRNALTSAVNTYTMSAASPEQGLNPLLVLAADASPPKRGYPKIAALPSGAELYMFGGSDIQKSVRDLWKLDLRTQSWSEVGLPESVGGLLMNSFTYVEAEDGVLLCSCGGIAQEYVKGKTFYPEAARPEDGQLYQPSQSSYMGSPGVYWVTLGMLYSNTVFEGNLYESCCSMDPDELAKCPEALVHRGCIFSPRAMHQIVFGVFRAGEQASVLYGGLGQYGEPLEDAWYIDFSPSVVKTGHVFKLHFEGVKTSSEKYGTGWLFILIQLIRLNFGRGGECWRNGDLSPRSNINGYAGDTETGVDVYFTATKDTFVKCVYEPLMKPCPRGTSNWDCTLEEIMKMDEKVRMFLEFLVEKNSIFDTAQLEEQLEDMDSRFADYRVDLRSMMSYPDCKSPTGE
jgi:hypothetical protein